VLDTYIIEELKRREQERLRKERQRPTIEIPVQKEEEPDESDRRSDPEPGSSVVHIQLL